MTRTAHAPMLISALLFLSSLVGCADINPTPRTASAAQQSPPVAPDHAIAGYWEDVAFSKADVDIVLAYANHATLQQLDIDAKLDLRAARSIIAAQPIATMSDLSSLHFVGAATMARLKAAALQDDEQTVVYAEPRPLSLVGGASV